MGRQAGNIDSIYARQIESMNHSRWDREERLVDTGTVPWQPLCHLILIFMSQIVFTPPWHVKYLMQDRFFYRTCFFEFLVLSANRLRMIVTVAKQDERCFAVHESTYLQIQISRFHRYSFVYLRWTREWGNSMERYYEISHLDSICSFAQGRSALKDNWVEFLDETWCDYGLNCFQSWML